VDSAARRRMHAQPSADESADALLAALDPAELDAFADAFAGVLISGARNLGLLAPAPTDGRQPSQTRQRQRKGPRHAPR
jgi:hypothetical protein